MRKSNKKWAEAFREVFPILLLKKKLKKNEIGEKLKNLSRFITFSHYMYCTRNPIRKIGYY